MNTAIKSAFSDDPDVMQMIQERETKALLGRISTIQLTPGPVGIPGPMGMPGKDGRDGVDGKNGIDGRDGKDGKPGIDGKDGTPGIPGKNGKDGNPGQNATINLDEIIDTLIAKIKKEKPIDISHIRNADSFIFQGTKYKTHELMHGAGTTSSSQTIATADISSQFNGIATTFTLPAYTSILLFTITGWPPNGALRPTVDFTTPTNTTVTLDAALGAPVSGTTGIILYI